MLGCCSKEKYATSTVLRLQLNLNVFEWITVIILKLIDEWHPLKNNINGKNKNITVPNKITISLEVTVGPLVFPTIRAIQWKVKRNQMSPYKKWVLEYMIQGLISCAYQIRPLYWKNKYFYNLTKQVSSL